MSLESATQFIRGRAGDSQPLGYRVQFDLGDDGVISWDGTQSPPVIDNEMHEAYTIMSISLANLEALIARTLDPTVAYTTGQLTVHGSMRVALKIGSLFEA
jgi:putative sterol carrier protein